MRENQALFQIKALEDNYIYLLSWQSKAIVIDPGEEKQLLALIAREKLTLEYILVTHHHFDHTRGTRAIKEKTHCTVIGPEDRRIPGLDRSVHEGETLSFGPVSIEVISTPGHTKPHLIYFFPALLLLFSGDLLFSGGVGRLFEGSPQEMWHSLQKVMTLPEDTAIYCSHEYTVRNLEFAHHIEPHNDKITDSLENAKDLIRESKSTLPSLLGDEKRINPFLRVADPSLCHALNLPKGSDPVDVFSLLRKLKDHF